jgi:membrane protein DedA with SNARE-associated domain
MIETIFGFNLLNIFLVFLWVFLDCFGVPGASISIIATASLARNIPSLILIILVVYVAACAGDILVYSIARIISSPLLKRLRRFSFFKHGEKKARRLLVKYEFMIIFFSRFAMGSLSPVLNYIGGIEKINRGKFILAVLTGEFLYALIFSLAGYLFGEIAINFLGTANYIVLTIVLVIIGLWIVRYFFKEKK